MMVPTYPKDDSRALKVYQEHQQVGRVAHQAPAFEIERNNYLATAPADSAGTFTVAQRAVRAVRP